MNDIIIGCDNGLDGGLVVMSKSHGDIIAMAPMFCAMKSKGREVDATAVSQWLTKFGEWKDMTVVLETPGKHSPGLMALCSMWDSYGVIRAICSVHGMRHHRIAPQTWQKVMLPGCAKGDTKPAALAKARQLWPDERWLRSERCVKPHDGMIDAALIAEYGRIKGL